jgi:hypothetical protein
VSVNSPVNLSFPAVEGGLLGAQVPELAGAEAVVEAAVVEGTDTVLLADTLLLADVVAGLDTDELEAVVAAPGTFEMRRDTVA